MNINQEIKELLKAWLAISIAFGILLLGENNSFWFSFIVAALTVGVGFIAHELAHRHYAKKFRKHAEFKANNMMLVLAIITSFLGVVIAIPGAVIISGFVTRKEGGIIATAGPAANLAIALLFLPLMLVIPTIAFYGMMINAWLALFNLIPFTGFDGHKIFEWNKTTYFILLGAAIVMNVLHIIIHNSSSVL